jgi:hypothetical protein
MSNLDLARWYAAGSGVALVIGGLAGFVDNPFIGQPTPENPLFHAGAAQNLLHVASGAVLLYIGLGLTGASLANALVGFGVAYGVLMLLTVISPNLFGLLSVEQNLAGYVLYSALAVLSAVVGWLARPAGQRLSASR